MLKICIRYILLSCYVLLINLSGSLLAHASQTLDSIVAIVNKDIITQSQLNQQVREMQQQLQAARIPMPSAPEIRQQALDHLIDIDLQMQLAKSLGINVDDAAVTRAIADIAKRHNLTLEQLRAELLRQGISYPRYRKEIHQQMVLSQLQEREVGANIKITDQEITDLLHVMKNRPVAVSPANSEYHLQGILISLPDNSAPEQVQAAKAAAEAITVKLKTGADFMQVADNKPGVETGDLGWRKANELPAIYLQQAQALKIGQIAGPFQAPNGFHIIKLVAKRGGAEKQAAMATDTLVRHILIRPSATLSAPDVKTKLSKLRAQILNGQDFAQLAEANSEDPGSAAKGGDLGWVKPGMLDPAFESVMNQLPVGQISQPFETQFGWHIVQVLKRRQLTDTSELMRNQAKQIIYKRKFDEALRNWLQQLRSSAYIKITEST